MEDDKLDEMMKEVIDVLDETEASREAALIVVVGERGGNKIRVVTNFDNAKMGKSDLEIAKLYINDASMEN